MGDAEPSRSQDFEKLSNEDLNLPPGLRQTVKTQFAVR